MSSSLLRSLGCLFAIVFVFPACRKAPQVPKRKKDVMAEASRDRRKLINFANALRKAIEWRQQQPLANSEETRKTLIKGLTAKFEEIPAADLPPEFTNTWERVLKAWRALSVSTKFDKALFDEGAAAAAELNQQLASHGYPDLRF